MTNSSKEPLNHSGSFVHLDTVRGLAALTVMVAHLRQLVFLSYKDLIHPSLLDKIVWGASGFGYQAVMIFFVLSGFFITRSIFHETKRGEKFWRSYLIKRLSRLWVVLLPCLIATVIWDSLSIYLTGIGFGRDDLGVATFVKNAFFLVQGATRPEAPSILGAGLLPSVAAPTFGSNGPLWSLTYEFWYYMIFPWLYFAIAKPRSWGTVVHIAILAIGCAFVGNEIVLYGAVWLAGSLCYMAYERGMGNAYGPCALVLTGLIFLAALVLSKLIHGSDYFLNLLVGLSAVPFVLLLAHSGAGGRIYRRIATYLADASYTVYLAHFPFLVLLTNLIVKGHPFSNSMMGYLAFGGIGAAVLAYCYAMYWLFERHTPEVRRYCFWRFGKDAAASLHTNTGTA